MGTIENNTPAKGELNVCFVVQKNVKVKIIIFDFE